MPQKYPEYTGLNLPKIAAEILKVWEEQQVFHQLDLLVQILL